MKVLPFVAEIRQDDKSIARLQEGAQNMKLKRLSSLAGADSC